MDFRYDDDVVLSFAPCPASIRSFANAEMAGSTVYFIGSLSGRCGALLWNTRRQTGRSGNADCSLRPLVRSLATRTLVEWRTMRRLSNAANSLGTRRTKCHVPFRRVRKSGMSRLPARNCVGRVVRRFVGRIRKQWAAPSRKIRLEPTLGLLPNNRKTL